MNSFKAMQEVNQVDNLLKEADLLRLVDVHVEVMENNRGKKTPHVVARYTETISKVNETKDGYNFVEKVTEKIEELNKYFSASIFAMGITQRADWIKADHEDRVEYLNQPGFHHPAMYKAK